ncbi:MAG: sodium ion-translocating decarboxylase subunit beta [Provencibacterium sp.]|jgi:Na+-transporting methylmalonyl-CoA/oxaloacetate decarboxylase beta subunit|nr:sodium ion-translocating decarboxylase subunit beta [Provencibacterium sp.]
MGLFHILGRMPLASSVGIIGGADGPTAIFVTGFVSGDTKGLFSALTLAWQGMAGIFVVMVAIAAIVWLLSRMTGGK